METMKALLFNKEKKLQMADAPKPKIKRSTDVRIEVKATGICGTDIHILKNDYFAKPGTILGHETSGVVESVGAQVTSVKVGDKVILDPTYHCGVCFYCQNNRPNYCTEKHHTETGVSSDGTFAKYHVVNFAFLHPLPEELSFEVAALSEPLACVLNALRQSRISHESRVLVVGAGPIGLLFGLAASTMGCEVTVGDISDYRLNQARSIFADVQNYKEKDLISANAKRKFDLVIDTSGRMLEDLLKVVDKGGDVIVAGLDYTFEAKIKPSFLTDNGIRIIGSIDSNLTFQPAIKMLANNKDFAKIITHTFALSQYEKAFALLGLDLKNKSRGDINGGKVVLVP